MEKPPQPSSQNCSRIGVNKLDIGHLMQIMQCVSLLIHISIWYADLPRPQNVPVKSCCFRNHTNCKCDQDHSLLQYTTRYAQHSFIWGSPPQSSECMAEVRFASSSGTRGANQPIRIRTDFAERVGTGDFSRGRWGLPKHQSSFVLCSRVFGLSVFAAIATVGWELLKNSISCPNDDYSPFHHIWKLELN